VRWKKPKKSPARTKNATALADALEKIVRCLGGEFGWHFLLLDQHFDDGGTGFAAGDKTVFVRLHLRGQWSQALKCLIFGNAGQVASFVAMDQQNLADFLIEFIRRCGARSYSGAAVLVA